MARILALLSLLLLSPSALAQVSVDGVRTSSTDNGTRVVFDLSGPVEHRVFSLPDPHRVVVDFENTTVDAAVLEAAEGQGVVRNLRGARRDRRDYRVVLDLQSQADVKSFLVKPNDSYGHRLVVDLGGNSRGESPAEPVRTASERNRRELVIAIDAGHGGRDPGAIGPGGTFEKDVVLEVARRLADLVDREPGMRPVLIRDGDYFLELRERTRRAREQQADMFISLHADANPRRNVQGASVYTLSNQGATSEAARVLAARENSADLIGGVSLDDKDDLVATVLLDLSRAATVESSVELAQFMLGRLGAVGRVHRNSVEKAGFVVLKSLDMPSVLVELAFISNPDEERRLRDANHQARLAQAIMGGVRDYAEHALLPELRMAAGEQREHVVQRGDTLSGIARRYQVNLSSLRSANNLQGDRIMVGSTLVIP
ncbi:N-acetylmuramoyl-L-alanine amidase [Alkalilimnicola ehrlichii]|uniref:N-acetylmuramoyl-L-alanine amidase AmiC n=2 Tax=Alkalilimnicola ehrlichii TaxID=351052 RepID=A0A3E0X1H9_9GAMM|nr:N-acetylmuramoyl-L-alanine amidase [Alkalilimnicola ehrlichii]RFA30606.1 N-acetylmuramoyl-L-alanine amidase [Alkalilimnicola ehrlichii]RFA38156.1 N-acetylmuramoyl-L-alanine amidase [Alkalilimnicola ehrlichii]